MPIYEYEALDPQQSCDRCKRRFEAVQRIADPPLTVCPACGKPVRKLISLPSIGASVSGFDDHARKKGFHKLKRLSKGEYEVKY